MLCCEGLLTTTATTTTTQSYLWWLVKSLSPLQPPGMRHNAVPLGGTKVRERLASAHRQASEKQTSATEVVACEKV
jgi:hypothetical protein